VNGLGKISIKFILLLTNLKLLFSMCKISAILFPVKQLPSKINVELDGLNPEFDSCKIHIFYPCIKIFCTW